MKEKHFATRQDLIRLLGAIVGTFLYAAGMNLFIVPVGVYSGGILGLCQIIRTILVDYLHMPAPNFDIAGLIYYIVNIPVMVLAFRFLGRMLAIKTLICMTTMTIFFSVVPIPSDLIIADDILASCLIGAILSGVGCGITLMMGASSGGMDIISIYFIKKHGNYSVGKINLIVNLAIYTMCFFLFDVTIVIYSIIFAGVSAVAIDKIHAQNINVEAIIISHRFSREMQMDIMNDLGRGITKWSSKGAYTNENSEIYFIILSKYEIAQLKRIIHAYDPEAFIVVKEGVRVDGNYLRKL